MARYKFVCLVNAKEGKEAEFEDWHKRVHLREVIEAAGFEKGERFSLAKDRLDEGDHRYLVIYEGEASDPAAHVAKLRSAIKSGSLDMPDLIASTWTALYVEQ